jgi:Ni/Co efflux regulator RcnB
MMPMTRSRMLRCFGALVGAAALLAALPAPAQAERRDHDRRGHHARRHDRDCDHDRGHAYGRQRVIYAPRTQPAPRWARGGHRHYTPAYYCGHCRTHFGSYEGLHGHVNYHHGVPTWGVPGVLAQVSFGWAFGF